MNRSESSAKKATRQCWECLKRRLVCDHTLPHCQKCQKNGKQCPGYDEQKPLEWIQTGKVNSRRRKKNIPPKIYTAPPVRKDSAQNPAKSESSPLSSLSSDNDANSQQIVIKLALRNWKPGSRDYWGFAPEDNHDKLVEYALMQAAEVKASNRIVSYGGRAEIEEVVSKKLHKEAAKIIKSEEPLKKLEEVLWNLRRQEIPCYDYLSDETSEVVQAVNYCRLESLARAAPRLMLSDNSRMFPEVSMSGELAPNPAIMLVPSQKLHLFPPAFHHTLVCLSLNHFIQKLPLGADRSVVLSSRSKAYHHRGSAIRALSQYVGNERTRSSDLTMVCILQFMSVEVSAKIPVRETSRLS